MKTRVLTGIGILAVLGLFVGLRELNTYIFDFLIGVIVVCSAGEVSRVFIRTKHFNNMTIVTLFPICYYATFVCCFLGKLNFLSFCGIILAVIVILFAMTLLLAVLDKKTIKNEVGELNKKYVLHKSFLTLFLMVYPTLLLGNLFILNHAGEISWFSTQLSSNLGLFLIVLLFAVSMMTDTMAYFVGSLLKGPKLCPFISPKKTYSGAIGGLIGGIIASIVCFFVANAFPSFNSFFSNNNIQFWIFLIYGVIGSVLTQIGDIFASWLKRKALTKDFSSIFPGHGGFMDRCDGLSFNLVAVLILTFILF